MSELTKQERCAARNAGVSAAEVWCFYCEPSSDVFVYLSMSLPRMVITWMGDPLARVVNGVERKMSGAAGPHTRFYFTAVDRLGRRWHGQGPGPGMYARMRRAKVFS